MIWILISSISQFPDSGFWRSPVRLRPETMLLRNRPGTYSVFFLLARWEYSKKDGGDFQHGSISQCRNSRSRSSTFIGRQWLTEMNLWVVESPFCGLSIDWQCLNFGGWHWIIQNPPEIWIPTSSVRRLIVMKPVRLFRNEKRKSWCAFAHLRGSKFDMPGIFIFWLAWIACFHQLISVCFGLWQWSCSCLQNKFCHFWPPMPL